MTLTDTELPGNGQNKTVRLTDLHLKILALDLILESDIPTTLWISDLHGEGRRFVNILRGRFGLVFRTCKEALPQTLGNENISYLGRVIRQRQYISDPGTMMDRQDVLLCLATVLRHKLRGRGGARRLPPISPPQIADVIARLISEEHVPDIVFERIEFMDILIARLSDLIMRSILDHLVVLGDIMDRGGEPDKIIRILNSPAIRKNFTLIYGNHDLLWMGACAGSRSLIAEALRITCRYDHMDFLARMELDISALREFALRTYPPDKITGKFKAKTPEARSMEKALAIIQFKLEEKTIREFPEFEMSGRLWLEKFAQMLKSGNTEGITDTHLPTLDLDNPLELTAEEERVMDELHRQFIRNSKLKYYIGFFFRKGKMYHVSNNILNIHALIPSTPDGGFETVFGKKGVELFNWLDSHIRKTGHKYLADESVPEADLAIFFYLWCGPKSPLFGKNAMKTFERYFFSDKTTHKETTLYWEKNLLNPDFRKLIQHEFRTGRVIFGHVPRDYSKGQTMAIADGFAINVDGGFAEAYFNRGHALVHTPQQLYGIILPTPEELETALTNKASAPLKIEIIHDYSRSQKIKDTMFGLTLKERRENLYKQLRGMTEQPE